MVPLDFPGVGPCRICGGQIGTLTGPPSHSHTHTHYGCYVNFFMHTFRIVLPTFIYLVEFFNCQMSLQVISSCCTGKNLIYSGQMKHDYRANISWHTHAWEIHFILSMVSFVPFSKCRAWMGDTNSDVHLSHTMRLCVNWSIINPFGTYCQVYLSCTVMLKTPNVNYRWKPFHGPPYAALI
jgi:hypothetical protein